MQHTTQQRDDCDHPDHDDAPVGCPGCQRDEIVVTRPARVRRTWGPGRRDVVHRVEVGNHTGPARRALCGAQSRGGPWVLEPTAPLSDCGRCLVKENLTR